MQDFDPIRDEKGRPILCPSCRSHVLEIDKTRGLCFSCHAQAETFAEIPLDDLKKIVRAAWGHGIEPDKK